MAQLKNWKMVNTKHELLAVLISFSKVDCLRGMKISERPEKFAVTAERAQFGADVLFGLCDRSGRIDVLQYAAEFLRASEQSIPIKFCDRRKQIVFFAEVPETRRFPPAAGNIISRIIFDYIICSWTAQVRPGRLIFLT